MRHIPQPAVDTVQKIKPHPEAASLVHSVGLLCRQPFSYTNYIPALHDLENLSVSSTVLGQARRKRVQDQVLFPETRYKIHANPLKGQTAATANC